MNAHFITFLLLLLAVPFAGAAEIRDIVFDIDETIGYKIRGKVGGAGDPLHAHASKVVEVSYAKPLIAADGAHLLKADGTIQTEMIMEKYRIYDGITELFQKLKSRPGVRVSFFSGGSNARNFALLDAITLPDGSSARQLAYRVLGEDDLTRVSNTGRFREMFRKDLRKVNVDLANLIMVDDIAFMPPEQRRHLLHLGEDFPYAGRRLNIAATEEMTLIEAAKIKRVGAQIISLLELAEAQAIPLTAVLAASDQVSIGGMATPPCPKAFGAL